jgi:hypothetical protein
MTRRQFAALPTAALTQTTAGHPPSSHITLRIRTLDRATGTTMPATLVVRSEATGAVVVTSESYKAGARSAGLLEVAVPPGPVLIEARRGFDYSSATARLDLASDSGQIRTVDLTLARRTPLAQQRWVCGDSHVHMIHGENTIRIDFPYVATAARAEALDYLSVAQAWALPQQTPEAISAACRQVTTPDCLVTWNLEMPKNYLRGNASHCLGHGWTFGMDGAYEGRNVIQELSAMSAADYERDERPAPNFESHALIHAAGGIVSYTHPARSWIGAWGGQSGFPRESAKFVSNLAQELPFDVVAGPTFDMLDIMMQTHESQNQDALKLWYLLLNHGYRIAGTTSSDATFDNPGRGAPGAVRIYTRLSGPKTIANIRAAMKAGRNFVTSGPLMLWTIGPHSIGDSIAIDKPVSLDSRLDVWSSPAPHDYLTRVELVRNGDILRTWTVDGKKQHEHLAFRVDESRDAWYVIRCFGSDSRQVATSNPIYFETRPYTPPKPTTARLRLRLLRNGALYPGDGLCEVLEYVGMHPRVLSKYPVKEGIAAVEAPATARLRITLPGTEPLIRSLILDHPPLLRTILDMRVDRLLDWATYESIQTMLSNLTLDLEL